MADKQVRKSTTAEASSLLVPSLPLSLPALRSRVITGEELELQLRGPRGSVQCRRSICCACPFAWLSSDFPQPPPCQDGTVKRLTARLVCPFAWFSVVHSLFFYKKKLQFFSPNLRYCRFRICIALFSNIGFTSHRLFFFSSSSCPCTFFRFSTS